MTKGLFWSDHARDLEDPVYREEFLRETERILATDRAHNEAVEEDHQSEAKDDSCPLCRLQALVEVPNISRRERRQRRRALAEFLDSLPEEE
jgi:ferric-dicitrate binding protein FerR (iron transport regulator)